ncbi:glycosyl hydrolase family 43 [Micractinium conductrix]|uniref:Glycosyl hydrolase family 43 n=1 Tax=Micractinium conductrix TaxID=554055 RepID=A0A2P6VB37_9CHLO|nr:glycosyl hydrolase family 43 [Micractinium conductrix]|eukprot:PSC71307.1 glycosyl hydrolase family 43 [Micractinium conductrix]
MLALRVLLTLLPALAAGRTLPGVSEPSAETTPIALQGGTRPLDTDGNELRAHGGGLVRHEGLWWWVGTSQKVGDALCSTHVNVYSSEDLRSWSHRGVAFTWQQITGFPDVSPYGHLERPPPPYRIERPKVLFNAVHRRWTLFFHLDTPNFEVPAVGVAISNNITGPYTWVRHIFPDNNTSYDMTVYQDPASGDAYLVRSCPVMTIAVSRLHPDWLDTDGLCSKTGLGAEGPAVFHANGRHYIFASHLTGWAPNPPLLHESTAGMCSTAWRLLPQPSHGPLAGITYDAQSTFIHTHTFSDGQHLLLWMGDRWNAQGPGGVGNATYVWLPLLPRAGGQGFELVWAEGWTLAQYKGAVWDEAARGVRFAGERQGGAAAVS